tara:strand:- start:16185 stop:16379 length:195 start_codon:yes stop_codon:yes gene_type:complete
MAIVKISESSTATLTTDSAANIDIAKQTVETMEEVRGRLDILIKHNETITSEIFTEEDIEDDSY